MELYGKFWPQDFTKRFFLGMHMPDTDQHSGIPGMLKDVKIADMIGRLADTGCDTLYFYMSCHMGNCYYPTKVKYGRVHSAMGKNDWFAEAAAACLKHKIVLVAVYEFIHLHYLLKSALTPRDWKHYRLDQHGKEQAVAMCWNGGYGDFVLAQIEEVARQYPVAGFYVDMLDYPGRELCPACRNRFRDELGKEPPTMATSLQSPVFKEYKMWTFREAARYLNRIRACVHKHIPGATVVSNYHVTHCEDFYEVRSAVDYVTSDPLPGYGSAIGLMEAAKKAQIFRCLSEDRTAPFDILFNAITLGGLVVIPMEPYLSIAATTLANGGWPCLGSYWGRQGDFTPGTLGQARHVYRHVDKVAPWVGNWKSLKTAGIYLSQETQFLFLSPGDKLDHKSDVGQIIDMSGAAMMLGAEHILTDMLTRLQLGRLANYPVIYLPNVVCLSDTEVKALRTYVRDGGTLVADGLTSLADEWGNLKSNFRLADVFGVDFAGKTLEPYLALQMLVKDPGAHPLLDWESPNVSVHASAAFVTLRAGASEIASLHDRYRPSTVPGELFALKNAFVVEKPLGPALVENRYGKGRCLYFSANIFRAYATYQVPEIRKLAARWLIARELKDAPVRVAAHACVKVSAFERPGAGCWIVHLLNHQSIPNDSSMWLWKGIPLTEELVPVHDVRVTLHLRGRRIRRVKLVVADSDVIVQERDGLGEFVVPVLRAHEVAVIEFTESWDSPPETVAPGDMLSMIRDPAGKKAVELKVEKRADDGWTGLGADQDPEHPDG